MGLLTSGILAHLPSHQRAQTSACLWRTGCSR
jgi:hypothetical protein